MNTKTTAGFISTTIVILMTSFLGPVGNLESATPVPPFERMALIALYQQTNGAAWFNKTDWLTPDGDDFNLPGTECTWYGVTCDGNSSVIMIDLHDNNLSGPIPLEIVNLKSLMYLSLTSNRLTGSIPAELGHLLELQYLWLSSNQLTGSIPPELGIAPSLVWLKVNDNELTGSIPPELGYLFSLEYLGLSNNRFTGPIPPDLGNLSSLVQLELDSNHFYGPVPAEITSLTELKDGSGLSSRWNAIYTDDASVDAFMDQKHSYWGDWHASQTVAPGNFQISSIHDFTAWLVWDVEDGQNDPGGFEVFYAPSGSDSWISGGWTWDKTAGSFPVTGLDPGTTYDFSVRTFTEPTENNKNAVDSDLSPPLTGTTADLACSEPIIEVDISQGRPYTLTVGGSFDSYLWSTGETTAAIEINPQAAGWFWVNVTAAGSCEEAAAVYVEPSVFSSEIFSDGFETGDVSAWS